MGITEKPEQSGPDNFIQAPGFSQSLNRYSYCWNNPLKYTDPTGNELGVENNRKFFWWTHRGDSYSSHSIGPGSGNHWSDQYRSEYGNFMLMNQRSFDNKYGDGAYLKGIELNKSSNIFNSLWKSGNIGVNSKVFLVKTTWLNYSGTTGNLNFDGPDYTYGVEIDNSEAANYGAANSEGYYPEGSYSYDKTHIQYLPAEGIGLLGGWSNVRGNAKVYLGSDGKYYANVSATGYTPASTKGTVNFSGSVDVLSGNKVISSHSLHPFSGPSIIQSGRQDVGSAVFALPNVNNDVYLRFNVGYSYSEGVGYAVPIPGQGHYNIQIGFTIDAWTY